MKMGIRVVSFGLDANKHLTLDGARALQEGQPVYLRTGEHSGADFCREQHILFETFDSLYSQKEDFDELNKAIVNQLLDKAQKGPLVYGVMDATTDETVALIINNSRGIPVQIVPGLSFSAVLSSHLLSAHGQRVNRSISALNYKEHVYWAQESLLLVEIHSRLLAGEIKLWLLETVKPEEKVLLLTQGEEGIRGEEIPLELLDRQQSYDYATSLFVPALPLKRRAGYHFYDLLYIIKALRSPEGCPWDREQTHQSLRPYLIEEAYEAVAAIDQEDWDQLYDELGDVLLQVVLHSEIGSEHGEFTVADVVTAICKKMIHRHPHVFSDVQVQSSDEVVDNWAQIKQKEKGIHSIGEEMTDVPISFPALLRAEKVQSKARRVGFDWEKPIDALEKVFEEAQEVKDELENARDPMEELGDLLFACVNVTRIAKGSGEILLNQATQKFINRFSAMENAIKNEGKALKDLTFSEMDVYWNSGKRKEGKL